MKMVLDYLLILKKAVELYQLAANQGHIKALESLAKCYESGRGVPRDPRKAAELNKQAGGGK